MTQGKEGGPRPIANIRGSAPEGLYCSLEWAQFLSFILRLIPAGFHAGEDPPVEMGGKREGRIGLMYAMMVSLIIPVISNWNLWAKLGKQRVTRKIVSFRENAVVTFAHE